MNDRRPSTSAQHAQHVHGAPADTHERLHGASDDAGSGSHDRMSAGDHEHADHGGHAGHGGHGDHVARFQRLFWIMLILAAPVVGASGIFATILGYTLPDVAALGWVSPVLGTLMYAWGERPFLTGAVSELKSRRPGMMLLIALAITIAFLASWGASLGLLDHELDFWWELALLIVIMLLGHWIEMRSLAQTSSALESLAALLPDEAERVDGDDVVTISPAELRMGDVVIVRPGGRVPADGTIVQGTADVDESMITGESQPVSRGPGARVVAGTVATDTAIRVQVTAIGDDTALAGIQRLVTEAQSSTSRAQRLADTAAGWLFWFALSAGILTAIAWTLLGRPEDAVIRTVTVLVIACPHALGLAIPLVVSIATERAAKAEILIKDRLALETMRTVDTVLFDETGTLTKGEPTVVDVLSTDRRDADGVLAVAAAVEADSEHPLARAIVAAAARRELAVPRARPLDDDLRRMQNEAVPDDLPEWLVWMRDRGWFPQLWEAVQTHCPPSGVSTADALDVAGLLASHADYVLHNVFREESGLGDFTEHPWVPLVDREDARPAAVVVDGEVATGGLTIDSNEFVVAVGAPVGGGRVVTAVVSRAQLDLVSLEFVADGPDGPTAPLAG